jgi:hypothetical protein
MDYLSSLTDVDICLRAVAESSQSFMFRDENEALCRNNKRPAPGAIDVSALLPGPTVKRAQHQPVSDDNPFLQTALSMSLQSLLPPSARVYKRPRIQENGIPSSDSNAYSATVLSFDTSLFCLQDILAESDVTDSSTMLHSELSDVQLTYDADAHCVPVLDTQANSDYYHPQSPGVTLFRPLVQTVASPSGITIQFEEFIDDSDSDDDDETEEQEIMDLIGRVKNALEDGMHVKGQQRTTDTLSVVNECASIFP